MSAPASRRTSRVYRHTPRLGGRFCFNAVEKMTGDETSGRAFEQFRGFNPAAAERLGTARRKAATWGDIDWARRLSFEQEIPGIEQFVLKRGSRRQ
jgi:hypothetical protein